MALIRKCNLLFTLLIMLFVSCDDFVVDKPEQPNIKPLIKGDTVSRTLLVYIMAENSISGSLERDFSEIKGAVYDIPEDVRLFVYFDNSDTISLPCLYQYHAYDGKLIEDVVYEFEEDVCSSDTTTLGKVVNVIFKDYPTRSFDLIMGSHASGWIRQQSKSAQNRTIGVDNDKNDFTNEVTKSIEIEELAQLLERLPVKVDRLMFDACLMQGVEVAYALRNAADWIIASPSEIPAEGAPYDKLLPLFFNPNANVEDIIYQYKVYYDDLSYAVVLSAIRTRYIQELADITREYIKLNFSNDNSHIYTSCLAYVPGGAYYSDIKYPSYYDFNSVMKNILDEKNYESWKRVYDRTVPCVMISNSKKVYSDIAKGFITVDSLECGGVSMYIPKSKSANCYFNKHFRTTEWYEAAGWSEAGW